MPSKKKKDKAKKKEEAEQKAREEEELRLLQEQKEAAERRKIELMQMKDRRKQDNKERKVRVFELTEITEIIDGQKKDFHMMAKERRKNAKWERYMRCDGTPDPTIQADINTYINLQSDYNKYDDLPEIIKQTELDLSLIDELEGLMASDSKYDEELTEKDIVRFQETINNLYNLLQFKLDSCTHLELGNASKNANQETSNLQLWDRNSQITLCIWGNLSKNLRIKHFEFKELNFTFEIPKILALTHCAIRLLYTTFDNYSPRSRSYSMRTKVEELKDKIALEELEKEGEMGDMDNTDESIATAELLANLQEQYPLSLLDNDDTIDESSNTEKEDDDDEEVQEFPFPPTPVCVEYEDFDEPDEVVDLRAFSVVGGIYQFNLLHLPPQPNYCQKWMLTEVTYPPQLHYMDYIADGAGITPNTTADTEIGKEEEAKEETKEESEKQEEPAKKEEKAEKETKKEKEAIKEKETKKEKEKPKEKLAKTGKEKEKEKEVPVVDPKRDEKPPIAVSLKIPQNILFSENPIPVKWAEHHNAWVTEGFTDVKYAEDTNILHFKMTSFGVFSLIQDRYINMPFQSWEMRPKGLNHACLTITAAVLELEFEIKDGLCCITLPDTPGIAHIKDQWMKPEQLIKKLQWCGVNIFPSIDTFKYVCKQNKSAILEEHTYQQMSLVASAMGFTWSRWNGCTDRDNIIFQAIEWLLDEPLRSELQTVMVNKRQVVQLKLTEFDERFNLEPLDATNYYSNLYHFMKKTGSEEATLRINNTNQEFRDCIHKMLDAIKVLTYS